MNASVRAVMSTCAAVDACTKSGFGNIESVCDFNVVRRAGKGEYFIGFAGCFCCCCCFRLLLCFVPLALDFLCLLLSPSSRPWCGLRIYSSRMSCQVWISLCPCCCDGFLPRAAIADSAFLVRSLLITRCCASSVMKVMRSSGFIALDDNVPSKVGQYDSGSEDMMIVLWRESEIVEPMFRRLSCRSPMSWKCCWTSVRCVFGSSFSTSFMLASWSSASSRNNVLFVVASAFTASHMSCEVLRFFILLPRRVEVVERMTC